MKLSKLKPSMSESFQTKYAHVGIHSVVGVLVLGNDTKPFHLFFGNLSARIVRTFKRPSILGYRSRIKLLTVDL